jgi:hypothetical protein
MIEAKLRQYLVAKKWAAHDALDEDLVRVAGEKVRTGELSADKYFELTESEKADDAEAKAAVDAHFAGVEERLDAMHEFSETKQFKNLILDRLRLSDDDEDDDDEEEDEIMARHFQGGDSTASSRQSEHEGCLGAVLERALSGQAQQDGPSAA